MNKIFGYQVVFREEPEGGFTVNVLGLQGCVTFGETLEEAEKMVQEAVELYLESVQAYGEKINELQN